MENNTSFARIQITREAYVESQIKDDMMSKMILDSIGDICENEVKPNAQEWEEFKHDTENIIHHGFEKALDTLVEAGVLHPTVPESYEGMEMNYNVQNAVYRKIAKSSLPLAVVISGTAAVYEAISHFGSDAQKEKYLNRVIKSEKSKEVINAFALTEPNVGSAVKGIRTIASPVEGGYVINGTKQFISNAGIAAFYLVFAATEKGTGPRDKVITAFLVDSETDGLRILTYEDKLGMTPQPTGVVLFEDCKVSQDSLLGLDGQGMEIFHYITTRCRLDIAAEALGVAETAKEEAVKYSQERDQFGHKICDFPEIKDFLLNIESKNLASDILLKYSSYLRDTQTEDNDAAVFTMAALCKLFITTNARESVIEVMEIFGAYGYSNEYPIARILRDVMITPIILGPAIMMKHVIRQPHNMAALFEDLDHVDLTGLMEVCDSSGKYYDKIHDVYKRITKYDKVLHEKILPSSLEKGEDIPVVHVDHIALFVSVKLLLFKTLLQIRGDAVSDDVVLANVNNILKLID